ncbi:hypothetical protein HDU76_000428 [Blyttiomyces sp. JEL0837]|nr:hypothetical protein HDU76_000428 [Blyttiomyces sp. JEL0837]
MTTIGSLFLAQSATAVISSQTLPITIPQNSYFVASNLITAVEYLHRAFPEHPDVYTREANTVFHYIDPISGNITDVVDASDLYNNAQTFSDVVIGIETVMYNQIPNPDTAVVPADTIANLKRVTNYIANIASYDFSTSEQALISNFYNFTVARYRNLFSRDNTTTLIPFKALSLTGNPQATNVPTPLNFNTSIFDDIDGVQLNNTAEISEATQTDMLNLMVGILQAYGLPVQVIDESNVTTTTSASSITPAPPTTIFTSAEPTVSDPFDDGGFGRRRRARGRRDHFQQRNHNLFPRVTDNSGTGSGSASTPYQVLRDNNGSPSRRTVAVKYFSQKVKMVQSGASSVRAEMANRYQSAARTGETLKTAGNVAKVALQAATTAVAVEMGTKSSISQKLATGFVKGLGAGVSEALNVAGSAGGVASDILFGLEENTAMKNALVTFFGIDEGLAAEAMEITNSHPSMKTATTFSKTMNAVRYVASLDRNFHPDLQKESYEDIIGARVDTIVKGKFDSAKHPNVGKGTSVQALAKKEDFPRAEFDSLRTVMEGATDHVATEVEFDEEKFSAALHTGQTPLEETFGYYITAAKAIDNAVTKIAALTTDDADIKDISNADFLTAKEAEMSQAGGKGLATALKKNQPGRLALRALAKNLLRARVKDSATGELKMDEQALKVYTAIGEDGFKNAVTFNVRANLKATAARGSIGSRNVINNRNRAIFNNKRVR